ncbi:hypothetical protein SARC_07836 [Sphaeroforma arctica JP610]|uniref:Uncharacterized protein n=1 Tax=Sphaeroforma arctica JP610 TaxID=667725 RepID=A0A0L0FSM3_9EUKA|nr:hypothetical protein SARC_07836 [Sphaeroforma arctica JP610]KNC79780.1 hypothetical protein SARC_07836 [Sphaeroforma arctica JP610]|eukprot:XP_014153682.1 hypothetical protein SARC_07836 [Sphaeroforma arctica JP610]
MLTTLINAMKGVGGTIADWAGVCPAPLSGEGYRVVVVTGCDNECGFGRKLSLRLLERGYIVICSCFSRKTAQLYNEKDDGMIAFGGDLTDRATMDKFVELIQTTLHRNDEYVLWGLVNNAGVAIPSNIEWAHPDTYLQTMAVNFHVHITLTYHLLPIVKRNKGSRIVNVSSVCGLVPLPMCPSYTASKHALEAYSDVLRCEMSIWGVHVSLIEPGTMATQLGTSHFDDWLKSYNNAPEIRKRDYGQEWADNVHATGIEGAKSIACNPDIAVHDMLLAVTSKRPKTRYRSGFLAKYFFRPLAWVPDRWRDWFLFKMMYKATPGTLQ